MQRANVEKYRNRYYVVVRTGAEPEDVRQAIQFAEGALANRAHYGALTIATLERTGAIFDRDPDHITPADLARYYEVDKVPSGAAAVRYGK